MVRSVGGTASTLALVRLTISSNLVGCAGRVAFPGNPRDPTPAYVIPHYAAIFFAGSRSASRAGRLRNVLDPTLRRLERQFERLKRLHGMTAVSRDAKRSMYVMTLSGFSEKSA